MLEAKVSRLERMGYRFIGPLKHSAIKVCEWTRHSIRDKPKRGVTSYTSFCYKEKFYGISSHRCMQMSPAVFFCNHDCLFCWRSTGFINKWMGPVDSPKEIIDDGIEAQRKILQGFWGSECNKKKLKEAMEPNQVAISLVGEPCMYPRLPELIDEITGRNMTAFLVTNGTFPEVLENLKDHQPTNLYITLPAPDKDVYKKTCLPKGADWKKLMLSLGMLKDFGCRTVVRLTLVRGLNLVHPEKYASILEAASPDFVECKSFMSVGGSRKRLPYSDMPLYPDIRKFAAAIEKNSSYKITNEKPDSRVVLLER